MSSRSEILEAIRKNSPEITTLPEAKAIKHSLSSEELLAVFIDNLTKAGAEVVEEIPSGNILDFSKPEIRSEYPADCPVDKIYALETIMITGRLGVAENGAIWLDEEELSNRLLPFATQRLILKLDKNKIVHNMQDAYSIIHLEKTGYGVFISGPSKTADIEQSLVYGAHGAKELTVVLE